MVGYRRFGGSCCLYLRGEDRGSTTRRHKAENFVLRFVTDPNEYHVAVIFIFSKENKVLHSFGEGIIEGMQLSAVTYAVCFMYIYVCVFSYVVTRHPRFSDGNMTNKSVKLYYTAE